MPDPRFPLRSPLGEHPQRMGYIDVTGQLVIPYAFHSSVTGEFSSDGFAVVRPIDQDSQVVIDTAGKTVFTLPSNHEASRPPDKRGIFPVIHRVNADNPDLWKQAGNELAFMGETRHLAMTTSGEIAFEAEVNSFAGGYYAFVEHHDKKHRHGIMDAMGNVTVPAKYTHLFFGDANQHIAFEGDQVTVINSEGHELYRIDGDVHRVTDLLRIVDGLLVHWDANRTTPLLADIDTGKVLREMPIYHSGPNPMSRLSPFDLSARLPMLTDGTFQIKDKTKTTRFIDINGKPLMKNWAGRPMTFKSDIELGGFHDGRASYRKDGQYGYIDKSGKLVIERQFYFARNFSNGLARVAITAEDSNQNRDAYINKAGDIVAKSHSHF